MEPKDVIHNLKSAIADLKGSGKQTVAISALERYLDELHANADMSMELRKLEYQRTLAYYDAQVKHSIEMFKSVIEAGREALNAVLLVNGGAVIALLGFMGATLSKGYPATLGLNLAAPLNFFGMGVLLGALGFGARYCAQHGYARQRKWFGNSFTTVSIVFAVGAYSVFAWGLYGTYQAFVMQFGP